MLKEMALNNSFRTFEHLSLLGFKVKIPMLQESPKMNLIRPGLKTVARVGVNSRFITISVLIFALVACDRSSMEPAQSALLSPSQPVIDIAEGANPWTHLDLQNNPDHFSFAIISDLTGGYRDGVFNAAVERLNLVQPEFIMSVGDLIEGYTEDSGVINQQWDEFDAMLRPLSAPFFYAAGNHDYSNQVMADVWKERYGRDYYHFVHRDVLFLVLNTEEAFISTAPETTALIEKAYAIKDTDPEGYLALASEILASIDWNGSMYGDISEEQVRYFEDVIRQHPNVRWTFIFLHQPIWQGDGNAQLDRIEAAFGDRSFTVFAGHTHNYKRFEQGNAVHIRLGTTGGIWSIPGAEGNFDHITLVTMTDGEPIIANLLLDGILDEMGRIDPASSGWRERVEKVRVK